VQFLSAAGDLMPLSLDTALLTGTATVSTRVTGTKVPYECNRRGVCDAFSGKCSCQDQFGSSDGQGAAGALGDCGHRDARYGAAFETATTIPTGGVGGYIAAEANRSGILWGGVSSGLVAEQQERLFNARVLLLDRLAPPES
jgi:hypothetical protein